MGTVADGRALLAAAAELVPDVIVCDIAMPELNGLDAGRQLKQAIADIKLIFLTVHNDQDLVAETIRQGASGYLLKSSAAPELFLAIREALAGRTPGVTSWMVGAAWARMAAASRGEQTTPSNSHSCASRLRRST